MCINYLPHLLTGFFKKASNGSCKPITIIIHLHVLTLPIPPCPIHLIIIFSLSITYIHNLHNKYRRTLYINVSPLLALVHLGPLGLNLSLHPINISHSIHTKRRRGSSGDMHACMDSLTPTPPWKEDPQAHFSLLLVVISK